MNICTRISAIKVEKKLRIAAPPKENLEAFGARAVKYLKSLAETACLNYIGSMPARIEDVIDRKGGMGRR